jgi:hypothetical protein
MSVTSSASRKELEQLILQNIPRDALMAFEDAYYSGDAKGRMQAANFADGHRPSAAGQVKHFCTNESFHEALEVHGAKPTKLRGTRLVVGQLGIFNIARLNVPGHKWVNLRRSAMRKKLAEVNLSIKEKYVQGDFFSKEHDVAAGTVFILGVVDGIDANGIAQLTQVMMALPAPDLKSWLYINTMSEFLKLYDQVNLTVQPDNAMPKLKKLPKEQTGDDQGN